MDTWTVQTNRFGVLLETSGYRLYRVRHGAAIMITTQDLGAALRVYRSAVQRTCGA